MEKVYIIKMPADTLRHATDMLRYDGAYRVTMDKTYLGQPTVGQVTIETLNFTPDRWASFGVTVTPAAIMTVSAKDHEVKRHQSTGFIEGLRFAQKFIDTAGVRIVQD